MSETLRRNYFQRFLNITIMSRNLLHLSTSVNSHQDIILHNKTGQSFTGIFFQKEMYRKEKTLGKAAYL